MAALLAVVAIGGCATSPPKNVAERSALQDQSETTLRTMEAKDPSLAPIVRNAYGYAVFPKIAEGGVIVGGATGRGTAYQRGKMVGYVELNQGSLGAQLGGQTFSELIVFRDPNAFSNLKSGNLTFGADASAVGITYGAASSARFVNGTAVFVMPQAGAMVSLALNGQKIGYTPASAVGGSGAH